MKYVFNPIYKLAHCIDEYKTVQIIDWIGISNAYSILLGFKLKPAFIFESIYHRTITIVELIWDVRESFNESESRSFQKYV